METKEMSNIISSQKEYFLTHATKDVQFRIEQLKKLKSVLKQNEQKMFDAIYKDFQKSEFDALTTELSLLYQDIDDAVKKVKRWSKKVRVKTNLLNLPGKSYRVPEPLGTVLVIGAWNYPYLLAFGPVIGALAAGNTVVLKPSEVAWNSSNAMAEIVNTNFPKEIFHVIEGGVPETTALLEEKWDKIFFTGSTQVGKIIYQAAAKHLTPVTLELGGKSPAFITPDANLDVTINRIVWGKFLNAGQTCIAPDYLLVDEKIKDKVLEKLKARIVEIDYDVEKGNFTQIINERHYDRLIGMIDEEKVYYSGKRDAEKRILSPIVLKDVSFSDKVMQEEIFGPILPVISYKNINDAINEVKNREKPLSLYIFSNDRQIKEDIIKRISFGGGAINDSVMHIANLNLPFGGVGSSGMGSYHGKAGFDAFSHYKSIIEKATWIDPSMRYAMTEKAKALMKRMMG